MKPGWLVVGSRFGRMSNFGPGRGKKVFFTEKASFDMIKFTVTLTKFPSGEDFTTWSLKKEWVAFSKTYFRIPRPKAKYIKGSYDFFRKNSKQLLLVVHQKRRTPAEHNMPR